MDSSWKNNWHTFFFSCPSYLPFWRYAPLKKSVWNLMYAISYEPCMLAFLNFIYALLMTKNSWPVFFFLSELSPFLELCPFEKIRMKSCQQDISKSIWARGLKLSQLIGDNGKIIWLNKKKIILFFQVMALWKFGHFKLVKKISRKLFELGAWNLVSW